MERQCAWCLKTFNITTKKWEHGPAIKQIVTVCCPECKDKFKSHHKRAA